MTPEEVKAMSDEALNIKVADVLGWESEMTDEWEESPGGRSGGYRWTEMPHYVINLNVLHEIETAFDEKHHRRYFRYLSEIMRDGQVGLDQTRMIYATARQRAEALVLTMSV